jgi:uncharacterized membrane protein YbhN (UPF0104 family)
VTGGSSAFAERLNGLVRPAERLSRSPLARTGLTLAILAAAAWLIRAELRDVSFSDVLEAVGRTPRFAPPLSALFTLASYACLAVVEALALAFIGKPQPPLRVAGASAAANALSIAMGFGLASGTAVRLRTYAFAHLNAGTVAKLVLVLSAGSYMSGLAMLGLCVLLSPGTIVRALGWPAPLVIAVALLLLSPAGLWFVLLRRRRPNLDARRRAIALLASLAGSWAFNGAALFVLSPHRLEDFPPFLASFCFGGLLGSAMGVPGDLGVLDASVLSLKTLGAAHQSAAALILYRLIYLVAPLAAATTVLGVRQAAKMAQGARHKAV